MVYEALKHLHILAVVISGLLFGLRGVWLLQKSPKLQAKWVRIAPHANDTILLVAAMGMLVVSHSFPVWVHVKITLLLIYIGLGVVAFRKAKTPQSQVAALAAALLVYVFILGVAIFKQPLGFFAG